MSIVKPMDEKELVAACLHNDRKAQKELYDRYAAVMMGVCSRYANSKEEGEDILVEGFTKVFAHLGEFHFESSLPTWIRRIMLLQVCLLVVTCHGTDMPTMYMTIVISLMQVFLVWVTITMHQRIVGIHSGV